MHDRPTHVLDGTVLSLVRTHLDAGVTTVEHVPVGFGAWHWLAEGPDGPRLFVTLDPPSPRHAAGTLEQTYAAAAALARALPFVHAPLRTTSGGFTVPVGGDLLSATRWLPGRRPEAFGPEAAEAVRALHAATPPPHLRAWQPLVGPDLVERLQDATSTQWRAGPFGEEARRAIRGRLAVIEGWLVDYLDLCAGLDPSAYVATHGEPGVHNEWLTDEGLRLIDWESLLLAPPERDLLDVDAAALVPHDPDRRRLFDLEWRLSEIEAFGTWLRNPHAGNDDDRTALGGLHHELTRD